MKAPKSKGLTMGQLQAYKKVSKDSKRKQYWQGRIDALAGQVNYKNWLKKKQRDMNIKYLILITLTVIAFFVISGLSIYSVARAEGTLFLPCKFNISFS